MQSSWRSFLSVVSPADSVTPADLSHLARHVKVVRISPACDVSAPAGRRVFAFAWHVFCFHVGLSYMYRSCPLRQLHEFLQPCILFECVCGCCSMHGAVWSCCVCDSQIVGCCFEIRTCTRFVHVRPFFEDVVACISIGTGVLCTCTGITRNFIHVHV